MIRNFFCWVFQCFLRGFDCKGRSCRREVWSYFIFLILLNQFMYFVSGFVQGKLFEFVYFSLFKIISLISLVLIIPSCVRRLHDINLNGKWMVLPYGIFLICIGYAFYTEKVKVSTVNWDPQTGSPALFYRIIASFFLSIILGIIFVIFVTLMLKKGNITSNKYGSPHDYLDCNRRF